MSTSNAEPRAALPAESCCDSSHTAFHDPKSHFHRYSLLSDDEAVATATAIWERTNLADLEENILPTRPRATLILTKGADHVIETVALRRL